MIERKVINRHLVYYKRISFSQTFFNPYRHCTSAVFKTVKR